MSRVACVKHLVEAGANVNYKKKITGLTPLHWAAFNEDKNTVLYLLKHNAILQPNTTNNHTPLDIAGICENNGIVETILQYWYNNKKSEGSS